MKTEIRSIENKIYRVGKIAEFDEISCAHCMFLNIKPMPCHKKCFVNEDEVILEEVDIEAELKLLNSLKK